MLEVIQLVQQGIFVSYEHFQVDLRLRLEDEIELGCVELIVRQVDMIQQRKAINLRKFVKFVQIVILQLQHLEASVDASHSVVA